MRSHGPLTKTRRRGEGLAAAAFPGLAGFSVILPVAGHPLPPRACAPADLPFDYAFGVIRRGLPGEPLCPVFGAAATLAELQTARSRSRWRVPRRWRCGGRGRVRARGPRRRSCSATSPFAA